jgi:hypothetical protein
VTRLVLRDPVSVECATANAATGRWKDMSFSIGHFAEEKPSRYATGVAAVGIPTQCGTRKVVNNDGID